MLDPNGPPATHDLVARTRAGDTTAFDLLYRRLHDELLFAVRVHLGPSLRSKLQSEDILQSVAFDAFRAMPRVRAQSADGLRRYLHAMVLNKIHARSDQFEAEKRAGDVPLTAEHEDGIASRQGSGEPTYFESERFTALERALAALPDEMRRVIVLRRVDGLSSKEAAVALGKSDEAARKLYSRAMARLTSLLGTSAE